MVALVTGASRGIGAATIIELAKRGYSVVIHYHKSKKEAYELEEKIKKYNVETLVISGDISKKDEVEAMTKEVIHRFNKIDVLINNAGIAIDTLYEDKTVENFQKILNTNLIGTFNVCKTVEKYMDNGVILNISSNNALDSYYPMSLDYDASKAGVLSLTKNLAVQYAPKIRVNALALGWVNTPMNQEMDLEFKKEQEEKILLHRFAEPEEIAKTIAFLISEDASYINGAVITVDGGHYGK